MSKRFRMSKTFRLRTIRSIFLAGLVMTLAVPKPASASSIFNLPNGNIGITVDENCSGTIDGFTGVQPLPCTFATDPGPGGLAGVMTYNMLNPPGLVAGDVLLSDGGTVFDVIRFNPNQNGGSLLFYSDNVDGSSDGQADTPSPPGAFYTNTITIAEIGTETNNGAIYVPVAGQPGFVAGTATPVQYTFISDGAGPPTPVPEPATLTLLGTGLFVAVRRKRRLSV